MIVSSHHVDRPFLFAPGLVGACAVAEDAVFSPSSLVSVMATTHSQPALCKRLRYYRASQSLTSYLTLKRPQVGETNSRKPYLSMRIHTQLMVAKGGRDVFFSDVAIDKFPH